jgi:hypothetical protein
MPDIEAPLPTLPLPGLGDPALLEHAANLRVDPPAGLTYERAMGAALGIAAMREKLRAEARRMRGEAA